jgi:uncharacterized pyridoxal phosphate-containing UPF0001 family protein
MSLEKKLKENYGDELDEVEDIEELNLDGLASMNKMSSSDKEYIEQFSNLTTLSAAKLQLTSVENFPKLPLLKVVS